jgi:cell division protein FtsB
VAARAYAGAGTAYGSRRRASRRPGARRRRPAARRGASRIRWDRVGRVALTLVLAVVLFSYVNPALDFFHTYRATSAARAELRSLQHENTRLHNRVQSADDPAVLEQEARRQGMVLPGERAYAVSGLGG